MSLHSGKRIHGYIWDELPIDEYVIERVEALAEEQGQPLMKDGVPDFEWTPGQAIEDIWHEDVGETSAIEPEALCINEAVAEHAVPQLGEDEEQEIVFDEDEAASDDNQDGDDEGLIFAPEGNVVSDDEPFIEEEIDIIDDIGDIAQTNEIAEEVTVADVDDKITEEVTVADVDDTTFTNSIPRRANAGAGVERLQMDFHGKGYQAKQEYNFITNSASKETNGGAGDSTDTYTKLACEVVFTQMTAKKGFKQFGTKAVAAMIKEFTQLNEGAVPGKPVVEPTDASTLTDTEKKKALRAVNLIKEKWNGDIKGRSCVDGSTQRRYLKQDESMSSPTASLESLLITLLIDAYEERDVATFDVPGAYLQASLAPRDDGERVLMKLVGDFVDIMCKVNPEHEKNIIYENGQKVLYMEILQAIYGCI